MAASPCAPSLGLTCSQDGGWRRPAPHWLVWYSLRSRRHYSPVPHCVSPAGSRNNAPNLGRGAAHRWEGCPIKWLSRFLNALRVAHEDKHGPSRTNQVQGVLTLLTPCASSCMPSDPPTSTHLACFDTPTLPACLLVCCPPAWAIFDMIFWINYPFF